MSLAKAATFCLLFVTLGNFQLWGATVTTLNTSNTALGVNLVVGDAKTTTITGAAPNAPVSVHAFNNGADVGSATVGTTNAQGGFTVTGHAVAGSIGSHMDIWSVSGAEVGRMEYQVIDKPTSLGVLSVGLAPVQCASGRTGALGRVRYQMTGASGPIATMIPMTPTESGVVANLFVNGVLAATGGPYSGNTCGPSNFEPDCLNSQAASDGTFNDDPIGTCWANSTTYTQNGTTQNYAIKIGSMSYPVHSHTWNWAGTGIGHGTGSSNDGHNWSK